MFLLSPLAIVLLAGMSKHIDTLLLKGKIGDGRGEAECVCVCGEFIWW